MFKYMIVAQLLPSPVNYLVALVIGVAVAIATNRFKSKKICGDRADNSVFCFGSFIHNTKENNYGALL